MSSIIQYDIKKLIEKSNNDNSVNNIIDYIIHNNTNKVKHVDNKEDTEYLKNLYKYNNINYKIYNINKYLKYISEY